MQAQVPIEPDGERVSRADRPSLAPVALTAVRTFTKSVAALIASFAVSLAIDLLMAPAELWMLAMSAVQAVLVLGWLSVALAAEREPLPQKAELRVRLAWMWNFAPMVFAVSAMGYKWWIALSAARTLPNSVAAYRVLSGTLTLLALAGLTGRRDRLARFFTAVSSHPARSMALSFALLTLVGGVLLTLPVSVRAGQQVDFIDAWFMSTSAVCVTGLAVHAIPTTYSTFGQGVLLALVQIGGLGIMVLSAALVILAGRKLEAKSGAVLAEALDADSLASLKRVILVIVGATVLTEALGALALHAALAAHPEVTLGPDVDDPMAGAGSRKWSAIFLAVSAFCNAGFTLTRDNLVPFVGSWPVCLLVMTLITIGGIGFPVLSEVAASLLQRLRGRRPDKLSLHARVSLLVSLALVLVVAFVIGALEWGRSLANLSLHERVLAALFQSVTLRTAGFNTVNIGSFSHATLMICCLTMFIGASPGGTGGGVKTTTFAVLFAVFRSELQHRDPFLLDRRLPPATISRAVAVGFVATVLLTFAVLALLLLEPHEPLRLVFEAVSAFGTVGLTADVTPSLSGLGRVVIILTMLIGRIGPLTLALAASDRAARVFHARPAERVLIG